MRARLWFTFLITALVFAGSLYVSLPQTTSLGSRDISLKQGLDLQGGVSLTYVADLTGVVAADESTAMETVRTVFENRANVLGVTEPEIRIGQLGEARTVLVELPGVENVAEAKELLGSTAQMSFINEEGLEVISGSDIDAAGTRAEPVRTSLQGGNLSQVGQWQVRLQLRESGREKFATATAPDKQGQRIAIILDGAILSAPTINDQITDGIAIISGSFDAASAQTLAKQIKGGALPVPVELVQEQTIGARLGSEAVSRGLMAGLLGLLVVAVFMIAIYRWNGLLASLALVFYAVLNLAAFKVIGVTLTLAGIAGFIISIGVAVDTNVLTFERLKEELRAGRPLPLAIQESFRRSWTSIRDSHVATLITAAILLYLGVGSVRGFALILGIGALLSLFTAITVVRTWMLLISGSRLRNRLELR